MIAVDVEARGVRLPDVCSIADLVLERRAGEEEREREEEEWRRAGEDRRSQGRDARGSPEADTEARLKRVVH